MSGYKRLYRWEDPAFNDAFERTVVNIHLRKQETGAKVFLLCGCGPQAGTTTIAINLAIAMAAAGWKTLLLDADMRKEAEFKRLSDNEKNLADYLRGQVEAAEILCATNQPNLSCISAGTPVVSPIQLLCSARMGELLDALKNDFDYVIIDAPAPCAAVDASILGALANEAVLVAAWERTTNRQIQSTRDELAAANVSILGLIVNRMEKWAYSHNNRDYRYFITKKYARKMKRNKKISKTPPRAAEPPEPMPPAAPPAPTPAPPPAPAAPNAPPHRAKKPPRGGLPGANLLVVMLLSLLLLWGAAAPMPVSAAEAPVGEEETDSAALSLPPEVLLDGYSVASGSLISGSPVTLRFSLTNTGGQDAYDLLLSFGTSADWLYPVYGETNTLYVASLAAGESIQVEKTFQLSQTAPEIIELPVSLRYQGTGFDGGSHDTVLYLPVFGISSFTSQIDVGATAYAGTPTMVSGYCTNTGDRTMSELTMHLDGSFADAPRQVSLGDLTEGGQVSVQEFIEFSETDSAARLSISFSFYDQAGNAFHLMPEDYSVTVLDAPPETEGGGDSQPTAYYSIRPYIAGGGVVMISLAALVVFLYRRRKER